MVLNKKYKIYNGIGKKNDFSKSPILMYKLFEMKGVYNFGELDLGAYGWTKNYPINENEEGGPHKLLIYKGPGTIVMNLDCEEDYHQILVFPRNALKDNSKYFEETKSMLEKELKGKLNDKNEYSKEKLSSNLTDKLESN